MIMERKIGEVFKFGGEWYQCIIGHCNQCSFDEAGTCKFIGNPYCAYRNDKKLACFKKLEKVGEPYEFQKRIIQAYKLYTTPFISVNMDFVFTYLNGSSTINIIIKQNKEDMEEKKLNLKPFDIQKAREGKPVCTRDGRKARIICFDRKFYHDDGYNYPIVAMVNDNDNDNELVHAYTQDGLLIGNKESELDLMMLPEKKEGWVNVYKERIYSTKEEAIEATYDGVTYVDTVKVCWEE